MRIIASSTIKKEIVNGILLVLTKLGYDCFIWDRQIKPFFDMLDEQKPDILLIHPSEEQALKLGQKEKQFKTVFFGYGEKTGDYDLQCVPYLKEGLSQEKIYVFQEYANTIKYSGKPKEPKSQYKYDVVYFTEDYSGGITKESESFIKQAIAGISESGIRFGIFGENPLNFNEYLGKVTDRDKLTIIKECKVGIDFLGGSHLDFAYFKKPCVVPFDNNVFFSCSELSKFYAQLELMLKDDAENKRVGDIAYNTIFEKKLTDCHITSEIFNRIGYNQVGEECLKLIKQM